MEDADKYGLLLQPSIKLHRQYFKEMVKLLGIWCLYRAPLPGKHYTTYAEINDNYAPPLKIGCIFDEHPKQQTMKKLGWNSELVDGAVIVTVDYDLPGLQQGALFIIPSGIDNAKGRLFRVSKMTTDMVYPASITCELVPEYENSFIPEKGYDYSHNDFTLINEEDTPIYGRLDYEDDTDL